MGDSKFNSKFLTDFKIVQSGFEIDRGAYGTIFKVKERTTDLPSCDGDDDGYEYDPRVFSVVKVLEVKSESLDRVMREVDILKKLEHPSIIKIIESWVESPPQLFQYPFRQPATTSELLFLFQRMEYGDLKSLRHWIRSPWTDLRTAYIIIYQITQALSYLHSFGIIHRDLKPENVVFATDNSGMTCTAKIVDFGLATEKGDKSGLTSRIGTDGYISPEVVLPGGKYDEKVDIYALGIMFSELVSNSVKDYGGNAEREFSTFLTGEGNYPFDPKKFQALHPKLINDVQVFRASWMTNSDPAKRLSASHVLDRFHRLKKINFFTSPIPAFDSTPSDLKIIGKSSRFLSSKTIPRFPYKPNPLVVTRATLKYIKFSPSWIFTYLKDFINLEYLEIVLENFDQDKPAIFKAPLPQSEYSEVTPDSHRTHPHLRTFIFHQLNYKDNQLNWMFMEQMKLETVLFFVPVPLYLNQLWENTMHLNIQCGQHLSVNIDPERSHFHINGPSTSNLLSVLNHIAFKTVSLNSLSSVWLIGIASITERNQITTELKSFSFTSSIQNVNKLILTDTKVLGYNSGRLFTDMHNLEELVYEGEQFRVANDQLPLFVFRYLPPKLKKLRLGFVSIILPTPQETPLFIELDQLSLFHCKFPPEFTQQYSNLFRVKHLQCFSNIFNFKPNFEFLKSVFQSVEWETVTFTQLDWALPPPLPLQEWDTLQLYKFGTDLITNLVTKCRIPFGTDSLKFTRTLEGFRVVQLNAADIVELDRLPKFTSRYDVASDFDRATQGVSNSFTSPTTTDRQGEQTHSEESFRPIANKSEQHSPSQVPPKTFYFDGIENEALHPEIPLPIGGYNFAKVPGLTDKSIKQIVIKNATIENISMQLLGCAQLEAVTLENVRWTQSSTYHPNLPKLKTFKYFENVPDGNHSLQFNPNKLTSILFFRKNGYASLWQSNLNILISILNQKNLELDHELGQVTLQRTEGATEILGNMRIDGRVTSLVIHRCHVSLSLIPSHLTSLNLVYVSGINFTQIFHQNYEGFPNLRKLYYEAVHGAEKVLIEEVSLTSVPSGLHTFMIGGVQITKLAEIHCQNLTLKNCIFPKDFCKDYHHMFKAERLLLMAGSISFVSYKEVAPLFEFLSESTFKWVGVQFFCSDVDYIYFYKLDTRQRIKQLATKQQSIRNKSIAQMLRESGIPTSNDNLHNFMLERDNLEQRWIGTDVGPGCDFDVSMKFRNVYQEISGLSMISEW